MSVQIVRFRTTPEQIPEVDTALGRLFDAVADAAPHGIRYSAGRVADEPDFLLLLELDDDAINPLLDIPAALDFRSRLGGWAGAPVSPQPLHLVGRYSG